MTLPTNGLSERLRAPRSGYSDELDDLCQEAAARIEKLEAALKPFAEACDNVDDDLEGYHNIWESPCAMDITVQHLRDARAALSESPQ